MITPEEILEKLKPIAKLVLNDIHGVDKMELFNKIMSLENQGYRCSDFKLLKRILAILTASLLLSMFKYGT